MELEPNGRVTENGEGFPIRHPKKDKDKAEGLFQEYYMRKRREEQNPFGGERRRVQAEQRQRQIKYEEYVKILRASSLNRKLKEQENGERYARDAVAKDIALGTYGVRYLFRKYRGFF